MSNTIPLGVIYPMAIKVSETLRESAGVLATVQKDFANAPGSVGESVTVGFASQLSTGTVTPASYISAFPTDFIWKSQSISLSTWDKAEFYLTSREIAKIEAGNWLPNQLSEAVRAVCTNMRSAVFTALKKANGYVVTSQSQIFNATDGVSNIVDSRKVLTKQLCPDGNRVLVISPDEEAGALKLGQLLNQYQAGDTNALRNGSMGKLLGFDTYVDNGTSLPYVHTAGTGDSYVLDGNHAKGAVTITVKTGSGTILENDIVTIGNFTYAVATALSSTTFTISAPGLMEAVSDGGTVTVATRNSTHDVQGYAFDPSCIMLVMRNPSVEGSMGQHQVITDPVSGLSVKLSLIPADEAVIYRVSALYGTGIVDPRKGCRICSA